MEILERLKQQKDVPGFEPPLFKGRLYGYQKVGACWLWKVKRGLLADQCGLGKTIQSLALLGWLRHRGEMNRCLVCVPANAVLQWEKEIAKFSELRIPCVHGMTKGQRATMYRQPRLDGILLNHELLRMDFEWIKKRGFDVIVFDEISAIRNHSAKLSKVTKSLARKSSYFIATSATPVQNDLTDIHSIFEAIEPSLLGNYFRFKRRYCKTYQFYLPSINRNIEKIVGSKNVEELRGIIKPWFLRRRLSDVEEHLPELVVREVWLDLHKGQKRVYDDLKEKTVEMLVNGRLKEVRKNIHTMQQCVDGLQSLGPDFPDESCKLDYIVDKLKGDLSDSKVVVYSTYKGTIRTLTARLDGEQIPYIVLSGDHSKKEREEGRLRFFEDPNLRVCIGTVAMEMGLNLHCASYMFLIDRLWNPARMEQIIGRIRRLGSEYKTVVVVNLFAKGTMEAGIYNMLKRKQGLSDVVFEESSDLFSGLSVEDLKTILS
jgi:SNF2 family DNA or RNA helicase